MGCRVKIFFYFVLLLGFFLGNNFIVVKVEYVIVMIIYIFWIFYSLNI